MYIHISNSFAGHGEFSLKINGVEILQSGLVIETLSIGVDIAEMISFPRW